MAEEVNPTAEEEEPPDCVIDTEALKRRRAEQEANGSAGSNGDAVLILLTPGTYGHPDDAFSAVQVGNAVLAVEQSATMLLLDDGVYFGVKGQDPIDLGLPNNIHYIQDFLDLGGRMLALRSSLEKRGLTQEDLLDGVEVIEPA